MLQPRLLTLMCPNRCRQSPMQNIQFLLNIIPYNMNRKMMYLPSGEVYENRKEAKLMMGHANYNRALRNRLMLFIDGSDLIGHNDY